MEGGKEVKVRRRDSWRLRWATRSKKDVKGIRKSIRMLGIRLGE